MAYLWQAETEFAVIQTLNTILTLLAFVLLFIPAATASTQLPSAFNNLQVSIQKSVLNEKDNKGCFWKNLSSYIDEFGELSGGQCLPGYHKQKQGEECHGRYGCCICEHGTYQPHHNNCSYCVQKTFCLDYGLEFEDIGSHINNSRCRNKTAAGENDYPLVDEDENLTTTEDKDSTSVTETTSLETTGEDATIEESMTNFLSLLSILAKRPDMLLFIFAVILFCVGVLVSLPLLICWVIAWSRRQTLKSFMLRLCCGEYPEVLSADGEDQRKCLTTDV